jgi:hypothetical protein
LKIRQSNLQRGKKVGWLGMMEWKFSHDPASIAC